MIIVQSLLMGSEQYGSLERIRDFLRADSVAEGFVGYTEKERCQYGRDEIPDRPFVRCHTQYRPVDEPKRSEVLVTANLFPELKEGIVTFITSSRISFKEALGKIMKVGELEGVTLPSWEELVCFS